MRPDLLSNAHFLNLTSRVVAACCQAVPIDAARVPALIAAVNEALRKQMAVPAAEALPVQQMIVRSGASERLALDCPQHSLQVAPIQIGQAENLSRTERRPLVRVW